MLFDTHCHLNDEALLDSVEDVINEAKNAGVKLFLVPGWDKKSSETAVKLAERFDCVYAAVGFHPCNLENLTEEEFIETLELSKNPKVVAIGEIGLDYHWEKDLEKQRTQKLYFERQIKYANEVGLPIIVHNREAFYDCIQVLKNVPPKAKSVMHCYSGSVESLNDVFNLNLIIGLDGPVTFTNSKTPKEVAYEVPLENLVVETDSPYLAPHPLRGTINEPKNLALIIEEISKIKEISKKHLADVTFKNSCGLFGIKYETED